MGQVMERRRPRGDNRTERCARAKYTARREAGQGQAPALQEEKHGKDRQYCGAVPWQSPPRPCSLRCFGCHYSNTTLVVVRSAPTAPAAAGRESPSTLSSSWRCRITYLLDDERAKRALPVGAAFGLPAVQEALRSVRSRPKQ